MDIIIQTDKSFLNVHQYTLDEQCIKDVSDKLLVNPEIEVYGKRCYQHRSIGFFSDESLGYKYSRKFMKSQPLSSSLKDLLNIINLKFNLNFNGILVNRYENGDDYISAHSDDEKGIKVNDVISISWGQPRNFRIRDKNNKKIIANIPTLSGLIIHMGGEFQREFTHEIPKEKKINGIRYSFTFRTHIK